MMRWSKAVCRDHYRTFGVSLAGDYAWKPRISGISQYQGFPSTSDKCHWLLPESIGAPPPAATSFAGHVRLPMAILVR